VGGARCSACVAWLSDIGTCALRVLYVCPTCAARVLQVTIPGIVYVIDCMFVKMRSYNAKLGIDMLTVTPVSKAFLPSPSPSPSPLFFEPTTDAYRATHCFTPACRCIDAFMHIYVGMRVQSL